MREAARHVLPLPDVNQFSSGSEIGFRREGVPGAASPLKDE